MTLFVNDSGTPRDIDRIAIDDSGTIRNVARAYVNDGGTVREVFDYGIVPVQSVAISGTRSNVVTSVTAQNEIYQIELDSNFNSGTAAGTYDTTGLVTGQQAFTNFGSNTCLLYTSPSPRD